jgi:histone-binding protein RBBP4
MPLVLMSVMNLVGILTIGHATRSIDIMCVDCSPFDSNLLITGSADRSVAVWDARNVKCKLFSLRNHKEEVIIYKFIISNYNI